MSELNRARFMDLAEKTLDRMLCNDDESGDMRHDSICDIADALARVHREALCEKQAEQFRAYHLKGEA